jgi:hypothetical protein
MLLQPHEFIGDVQRGENGHAQRVNRVAVGGDGAHLGVDRGRQLLNVFRIVGAQMIGLIVDIYTDGRGGAPDLRDLLCHVSPVERLFVHSPSSSICLSRRSMRTAPLPAPSAGRKVALLAGQPARPVLPHDE